MFTLIKVLTSLVTPVGLCLVLFVLGLVMLFRRKYGQCKVLFLSATILLYLFSIDPVSHSLIRSLENRYLPVEVQTGDGLIVLGGGATSDTPEYSGKGNVGSYVGNRLITATEIYNDHKVPMILAGGKAYANSGSEADIGKRVLIGMGIPEDMIYVDNRSMNTRENARNTLNICKDLKLKRVHVITSAFHIPRSKMYFDEIYKDSGIKVMAYPCDYQVNIDDKVLSVTSCIPNSHNIMNSTFAIKEYLGILAIKMKVY